MARYQLRNNNNNNNNNLFKSRFQLHSVFIKIFNFEDRRIITLISCHNLADLRPRTKGFSPKYLPRIFLKCSADKHMKIAVVGEKLANISGGWNDYLGGLRWSKDFGISRVRLRTIDQNSSVFEHLLGDQSDASVAWWVESSRTQSCRVRRLWITNVMPNKIIYNRISVVVFPAAKMMFWRLQPKQLVILWISLSIFMESCNLYFAFQKIGTLYCPDRGKYSVGTECRKAGLSRLNQDSWQP